MNTTQNQTNSVFETLGKAAKNTDTSWSIGTFGAIAEFFHCPQVPTRFLQETNHLSAENELGKLSIEHHSDLRLVPYEGLSTLSSAWTQGVLICLPQSAATLNQRHGIQEIEPDSIAREATDRNQALFDLGLGVAHLDACIRSDDRKLISVLRSHQGKSLFSTDPPLAALIRAANPTRSFRTKIACIDVYQAIPDDNDETPLGPHTHVSERLLAHNRTQAATIPVPEGWIPVLAFYPPNPVRDARGELAAFDFDTYNRFQSLLLAHGSPEYGGAKRAFTRAMESKTGPERYRSSQSKSQRTAIRIAIRQYLHLHGDSELLTQWRQVFEPAG